MKSLLHHLREQPFLAAVSAAAVVHSSWSLSTYFTGPEPTFGFPWALWILPGLLLAFSVDVGLLSLAHQIRNGQRNRAKLLTFFVLSTAMAYSQFLYIVAHLPVVAIAAGVRADWQPVLGTVRDLAVVLLPALLPTALILYAFSDSHGTPVQQASSASEEVSSTALITVETPDPCVAVCPGCGWTKAYETPLKAQRALGAHSLHCTGIRISKPEEVEVIEQ